MAEITKPIALDETFNTTSSPSQNIADVLKGGLYDIAQAVGSGSSVSWNQIQASGDKIAEVTINGTTTDVYSPSVSGKADNSIIAPVLTTFQATATVKDKGTQFIYNGVLYEITATITAGTAFVVGTNVKVAKSVTEQFGGTGAWGTFVDLSSYNSSGNRYTFPSDGYVSINNYNSNWAICVLNDGAALGTTTTNGNYQIGFATFVKKGMNIYVASSNGSPSIRYYPLV